MKYVLDPNEDELTPEFDDDGQPIWRTIWLNELVKLRRATYEQDSTTANPEWYRAMVRASSTQRFGCAGWTGCMMIFLRRWNAFELLSFSQMVTWKKARNTSSILEKSRSLLNRRA